MTRVHIMNLDGFSSLECSVLEEITAAKLDELKAARARYMRPNPNAATAARLAQSSKPSPLCPDCDAHEWGLCATHRRACEGCGRADVPLHSGDVSKKLGPHETPLAEKWCEHCDPLPGVGGKFADGQADPWDLSDEELFSSVPLPRETPAYYGRDRGEFDPSDNKSDIQPFERTTK